MSQPVEDVATSERRAGRPMIALRNADVVVGGHTVLHAIDWELHAGEHWGIVGANGSGKTSFLKLISGTLAPPVDRGTRRYDLGFGVQRDGVLVQQHITLLGHELQDRYRRLGWNFSVRDVVLSGVFRTDVPRAEATLADIERAERLLAELELGHLAGRPFLELSRGEQRRVLLARSLAFEPKILLLDEPAAGLDASMRQRLNHTIEQISRHVTIIYTAHELRDLPSVINRFARLIGGRIVASGPFTGADREAPLSRPAAGRTATAPRPAQRTTGTGKPLIELEHVSVWIGERRLLDDLNWRLGADEHWLVRGTNGSGKSTFLRLLHGQFRSDTGGSISWPALGNPRNIWTLRRKVAWVSPELQAAYLFPSTVRACIASGFESSIGLMRRPTREEARWIDTLLERFELATFAERALTTLSYGQMRRVLIVRALVNKPRVLLLDEPWEGLDTPTLAMMHGYLEQIIAQGTQLVCASHVPRDLDCFTHELEIHDGRIARADSRGHDRRPVTPADDSGAPREN
jgi:molybdate transport system ATP-binding protein